MARLGSARCGAAACPLPALRSGSRCRDASASRCGERAVPGSGWFRGEGRRRGWVCVGGDRVAAGSQLSRPAEPGERGQMRSGGRPRPLAPRLGGGRAPGSPADGTGARAAGPVAVRRPGWCVTRRGKGGWGSRPLPGRLGTGLQGPPGCRKWDAFPG